MTNPFLPTQPTQASAPAGNPFATTSTGPVTTAQPHVQTFPGMSTTTTQPPALNLDGLRSATAPIVGEGGGADLPAMFGRLILAFPLKIERVPPYQGQTSNAADGMRDRLTATVVVLDDGNGGQQPIAYGGKPHVINGKPHDKSAPLPYVRKGMWINQSRLISQLRDSLPATPGAAPGMIAGRVSKAGQANNDPWYLIGATEAEVALVRQYLEAAQAGHVPHPLA